MSLSLIVYLFHLALDILLYTHYGIAQCFLRYAGMLGSESLSFNMEYLHFDAKALTSHPSVRYVI